MAQKRKTNHSKKLDAAADLLKKIDDKTARAVKGRLSDSWRDNLFEIMMTRADLAAPHKKSLAALPAAFRDSPQELPRFARIFWGTMKRLLQLAGAPAKPQHVAAYGALYLNVAEAFLKDPTRDHSKTMALLDKRLGQFEQFVNFAPCK